MEEPQVYQVSNIRRASGRIAQFVLRDNYPQVRSKVRSIVRGEASPRSKERALAASGLFDREFYSIQSGLEFSRDEDAIRHFLSVGIGQGATFHPLIEPAYFARHSRQAYLTGDVHTFLHRLGSDEPSHEWGPLFDPRALPAGPASDALSFLKSLQDETILPVGPGIGSEPVTWAQARHVLSENAADVRRQKNLLQPHKFLEWDESSEQTWLAQWGDTTPDLSDTVAIVLPVWNRPESVIESIASVQRQTHASWELIVVDDGSDDETADVVEAIARHDNRIRLIRATRGGVSAARNTGLAAADSKYVAFLDSDNTWESDYLRVALVAMRAQGAKAAYSALRVRSDDKPTSYYGAPVSHDQLLIQNYIDLNTFVAEREILNEVGGFDTSLRRWVDHDLFIRVSRRWNIEYLPFIGCDYGHHSKVRRISNVESPNWQYAVLGKNLVDWEESSKRDRVAGRVSVVVVALDSPLTTLATVRSIFDTCGDDDVEVVVVANGSPRALTSILGGAFIADDRVRILRLPINYNFAIGANIGFAHSSGEFVFFLSEDALLRDRWLGPLRNAITGGALAAQPVIAYADGTVQSAGIVFPANDGLPANFLNGHPIDDARRHDGLGFQAVSGAAMMMRADTFLRLTGFDPLFVNGYDDSDFCLRAARDVGGEFVVCTDSFLVHRDSTIAGRHRRENENRRLFHTRWRENAPDVSVGQWEKLGFTAVHTVPQIANSMPIRPLIVRPRRKDAETGRQSLRWAIKIGADFTAGGDRWGDVPFAEDLANALRSEGQEVVVDRYQPNGRLSSYLDDVVVAIRGRHAIAPQSGRINILWVISRPDLVTAEEVKSFDYVFAASPKWAAFMSELAGVPVRVMLQATNPRRFHYSRGTGIPSTEALFVGGPRPPVGRRIVADALEAGLDVRAWGPGWSDFIDPERVAGDYLSNDDLSPAYADARIVLNDHFEDMAEWGFVNNRLFDAVASGARVVSDYVEGIDDIFYGSVKTYQTPDDLARLDSELDKTFVSESERLEIADRIIRDHSFEKRAVTFLELVLGRA